MIFPGKKLGVFGSGQLGRMFTQSAAKMGYKVVVYSPESNSPASKAGALEYVGDYQDKEKVFGFLDSVEAITFEFENIPEKTLTFIKEYVKTRRPIVSRPSPECIEISQNRLKEKNFFQKIGLKTVNFYPIQNKEEVLELLESYSYPSILKTNRFGYDGKGQQKVNSPEELEKIIGEIKELDHILEEKLEFEKELSIIISRFNSGKIISYLPSENIHKDHILDLTIHPVWIDEEILKKARSYGETLIKSLDYVGVLGLEFFLKDGELYCNEFAPRPHNSGHFSMDYCELSQFDLQLYTLIDIEPEIEVVKSENIIMKNIIGPEFFENPGNIKNILSNPKYKLHLYQKEEAKPGRKMGHINFQGSYKEEIFNW